MSQSIEVILFITNLFVRLQFLHLHTSLPHPNSNIHRHAMQAFLYSEMILYSISKKENGDNFGSKTLLIWNFPPLFFVLLANN